MSKSMRTLHLNIPISKVDEEQRTVTGYATTEDIDSQGDIVDYKASKRAFTEWIGNIREMHNPIAIGKTIDMQFEDDTNRVMITAKLSESADGENAWQKVKEGVLTGFSIGGRVFKIVQETVKNGDIKTNVNRIVDYALSEVSLVDNPANPQAQLVMVKSIDGALQRVEVPEDPSSPLPVAWWAATYLVPIEKAQRMLNDSFAKSGVAVVDGDARDHTGASIPEVTPVTPKKAGTIVPKKVYGKDGVSTTSKSKDGDVKKSMYEAAGLLDLAMQLSWYIQGEQYEGEDVAALTAALETIKQAVIEEISEPTEELTLAVELANKVTTLKKGDTMKDVKKSTAVGGSEERDENAEVITTAEENGKPETTDVVEEVTVETETPVEEVEVTAKTEGEVEVVEPTEVVADGAVITPPTEVAPTEEAKSAVAEDLVKSVQTLVSKLEENGSADMQKSVTEQIAKVEKSMGDRIASLEEQLAKFADMPMATKGKQSFAEVSKGGEIEVDNDVQSLLKRQDELIANPSEGTPQERMQLASEIRKAISSGKLTV